LKVQELLDLCSEHLEADAKEKEAETASKETTTKDGKKESSKEKKEETPVHNLHQAVAVIGIALIAMNEEIGAEMALRSFGHLLHYGEPIIKRSVPLALALLSVSNPKLSILDTLSKFSHDSDPEVSYNSIFALGIVGAGTNNARLASMLRQLALFHAKDQNNLFMVRLAQGLTHLGKGTMTLNPYHSHKGLLCQVALGGLLAVLIGFIDVKNSMFLKENIYLNIKN
jgi:26S proteasome regulatory subunit N1